MTVAPVSPPATAPAPVALPVRADLERQLAAVVGFLEGGELDALLTLAVERFVDPVPPPRPLPEGVAVHQVAAGLVARHGWLLGIVVRHASPHGVAWRWWAGTASGTALSEADAVARVAAKQERPRRGHEETSKRASGCD